MNVIQLDNAGIAGRLNIIQTNTREVMRGYIYDKKDQPLQNKNVDVQQEIEYDIDMTVSGEKEDIGDIINIFTKSNMKTFMTDYILNIEVAHNRERVKLGYLIVTRLRDIIIEFNKILAFANKRYRFSIKGGSSIHNFFTNIKNNDIRNPGILPELSIFLDSFISEGSYDKYSDFDTLLYFPSEIQVDNVDNITWLQNNSPESFTEYLTSEFKFLNNLLIQPEILLLMSNLLNYIKEKIITEMPARVLPLSNVISLVNFDKLKNSMNEELEIEEIKGERIRYKINYRDKNRLFINFNETNELSDSFFNKYNIKIDDNNPYFSSRIEELNIIKNSSIELSNMKIFSENEDTKEVLSNFLLTRIMLSFEIHEYDENTRQSRNIIEISKIKEVPQIEKGDNRIYVQNTRIFKDFKPVKYKAEILDISEDLDPKKAIKHTKLGITKEYYGKQDLNIYNTSFAGLVYDLLEFFSERKDKKLEKRCKRFSAFIVLYVILNLEISYILVETLKGVFRDINTPYQSPEGSELERFGYYLFNKILFQFYNWITYNFDSNFDARRMEILNTVNYIIQGQSNENKQQVIENVINIMYSYYERIDNDLRELGTYKILFNYQTFESIFYLSEILNESPSQFKEDIVYTLGKCFEDKSFIFERNEPTKSLFRNFIRFYTNMDYKTYRNANKNDPVLYNPFINYNLYKPGNQQIPAAFNIKHKELISSNIEYFRDLTDEIIEYSISELQCKIKNCNTINCSKIFSGGYAFKEIVKTRYDDNGIIARVSAGNNRYSNFIKVILNLFDKSILTSMDVDCFIVIDDTEMQGIDVLNEIKFSDTFNKFIFKTDELNVTENEEWKILKNVNIQPEFLVDEDNKMLTINRCIYFKSDIFKVGHHDLPPSKNRLKVNSVYGIVLSKRKGDISGQGGYCKKNFKNDVLDLAFLSKRELTSFLRQYNLEEYIRLYRNFFTISILSTALQIEVDNFYREFIRQRPESYDVLNDYMMELFISNKGESYNQYLQDYNDNLNRIDAQNEGNITFITDRIKLLKVLRNSIQTEEVNVRKEKLDKGIIGLVKNRIVEMHKIENNQELKNLYIQIYYIITNELENRITDIIKRYIVYILMQLINPNIEDTNIEQIKNVILNQDIQELKGNIRVILSEFIPRLGSFGELSRLLESLLNDRVLEKYIKGNMEYLTLSNFRERIDDTITQQKNEITSIKKLKDMAKQGLKDLFYNLAKSQIIEGQLGENIKNKYMENRDRLLTEQEKITIQQIIEIKIPTEQLMLINNRVGEIIIRINSENTQEGKFKVLQDYQINLDISDYILDLSTYLVTNDIINETEFLYINALILLKMNKKKLLNELRLVFYGILIYAMYNIQYTGELNLNILLQSVNARILEKINSYDRVKHSYILNNIIFDFTLYKGLNINYDITDNYIDMITSSEKGFNLFENRIKENIFIESGNRFMNKRPCYYD
jgi:hypothetical protein